MSEYVIVVAPGAIGASDQQITIVEQQSILVSGTGSIGATGATGSQGAQGFQGPQGFQGTTGSQGATGSQGPQGFQGPQGYQGAVGATGSQGATGAQGAQGYQGPQGTQGPQGAQFTYIGAWSSIVTYSYGDVVSYSGSSYVSLIYTNLNNQPNTNPTLWGLVGAQGSTGPQGTQGPQGATGATGSQGATGPQGATGSQGATGAQGATGPQGFQGFQGATGPQGVEGGTTTLTTKGDILTRSATVLDRLPVGTNGYFLKADSTQTTGLVWSIASTDPMNDTKFTALITMDVGA